VETLKGTFISNLDRFYKKDLAASLIGEVKSKVTLKKMKFPFASGANNYAF
jgi:hypothetical protein